LPDKHQEQPRHRRETTARWRGHFGTRVFGRGSAPAWRRRYGGRWAGLPTRGPRPHADQRDSSPYHLERVAAGTLCHDGRQGASNQPLESRLAGNGRWPLPIDVRVTSSGAWPVSCVGCGDGSNKFIPTALRYYWDGVLGAEPRYRAG